MEDEAKKEWSLGTPGHTEPLTLEELEEMARDGRLRATDLVKKTGASWCAAGEVPDLKKYYPEEVKPAQPVKKPSRFSRRGTSKMAVEKAAEEKPERLDPMPKSVLSQEDLIRFATLAFDPRRLFVTLLMTVPLSVLVGGLLGLRIGIESGALKAVFFVPAVVVTAIAGGIVFTVLAFLTRGQMEGHRCSINTAIRAVKANPLTALLSMVLPLVPSVVALGVLFVLGIVRNTGEAPALLMRIGYIIPMAVSLVAVAGAFLYQLAAMYVPSVAAVEGAGLKESIGRAWRLVRRNPGSVISHWIVVTVVVGVVAGLFLTLSFGAYCLPELVFPTPDSYEIVKAWNSAGVLLGIYGGVAFGLAMVLPSSLLGMLGMISYLMLREDPSAAPPKKEEEEEEAIAEATFEVPPEEEAAAPPELGETDVNDSVEDEEEGK